MTRALQAAVIMISIHAPVKGATTSIRDVDFGLVISIHAPVKGATRYRRLSGLQP